MQKAHRTQPQLNAEALINNLAFKNDVASARIDLGIPDGGYREAEFLDPAYIRSDSKAAFKEPPEQFDLSSIANQALAARISEHVEKLIKKHRCSPMWHTYITGLIMYGEELAEPRVNASIAARIIKNDYIEVMLDAHVTHDDWDRGWHYIEELQNRLPHSRSSKGKGELRQFKPLQLQHGAHAAQLLAREPAITHERVASAVNRQFNTSYTYADISGLLKMYNRVSG